MTVSLGEVDDVEREDAIDAFDYAMMALDIGELGNRKISCNRRAEFYTHIQRRVHDLFRNDEIFRELIDQLIRESRGHWFLRKHIEELKCDGAKLRPCSFTKSISKFWKKHKVPILIGAGVSPSVAIAPPLPLFLMNTNIAPEGLWINSQFYPYISDQKAADVQFIRNLPIEFRQNLAIHSAENRAFFNLSNFPPNVAVSNQPSLPLPVAPAAIPQKQSWIGHSLRLMGRGIVDSPELFDPTPLVVEPHVSLGEVLETIGRGIIDNPELLDPTPLVFEPNSTASFFGDALKIIGEGVIDSPQLLDPTPLVFEPNSTSSFFGDALKIIGEGVVDSPQLLDPTPLVFEPNSTSSFFGDALKVIGEGVVDSPWLIDPEGALPVKPPTSSNTALIKILPDCYRIGMINGMNTTEEEKNAHVEYIANFAPDVSMDGVYNHSNNVVVDTAEIFVLNYAGISPNTADLLVANWTAFHEKYKDQSGMKYLQICHSQGAIHTYNALMKLPKEIRDRIMVVAIAPATVIPKNLCYNSVNYACKSDIVPYGQIAAGVIGRTSLRRALALRGQLILLDAPEGSTGLNHDFQNPVFQDKIDSHIKEYIKNNGNYK